MSDLEKALLLKRALEDRKDYEEFLKWVDEHNPDGYMTFKEFQTLKYSEAIADAHIHWNGEDPGAA